MQAFSSANRKVTLDSGSLKNDLVYCSNHVNYIENTFALLFNAREWFLTQMKAYGKFDYLRPEVHSPLISRYRRPLEYRVGVYHMCNCTSLLVDAFNRDLVFENELVLPEGRLDPNGTC